MYIGIDVHKQNSYVAVLDKDGEVVEEGRVENATLEEIAQQYAGSHAVIESTTNYYAIYDTLAEYLDVTVANPAKTRVIAEADLKNDRVDAKRLAVRRWHLESGLWSAALDSRPVRARRCPF